MLLEIAEIDVRPGAEIAFGKAMREHGIGFLAACEGVVSVQFGQCVENVSRFAFTVVWTSMDAHVAARRLDSFGEFRSAFGDMAIGGAMHHYEMGDVVPGPSA